MPGQVARVLLAGQPIRVRYCGGPSWREMEVSQVGGYWSDWHEGMYEETCGRDLA